MTWPTYLTLSTSRNAIQSCLVVEDASGTAYPNAPMIKRERSDRETRWPWVKRASPAGWWFFPPDHGNLAMSSPMLMPFFHPSFSTVRKRRFDPPPAPHYGTELNCEDRGVMPADRVLRATVPEESASMTKILPRAPCQRKRPLCARRPPANHLLSSGT